MALHGIYHSALVYPHKDQLKAGSMFSLFLPWKSCWKIVQFFEMFSLLSTMKSFLKSNADASDPGCHDTHVMFKKKCGDDSCLGETGLNILTLGHIYTWIRTWTLLIQAMAWYCLIPSLFINYFCFIVNWNLASNCGHNQMCLSKPLKTHLIVTTMLIKVDVHEKYRLFMGYDIHFW